MSNHDCTVFHKSLAENISTKWGDRGHEVLTRQIFISPAESNTVPERVSGAEGKEFRNSE